MHASPIVGIAAAALAVCGLCGCVSPPGAPAADPDTAFLQDAVREDLLSIRLGELAQRYAQIPDVASYGRQMAADHASALETLRLIAQARQSEIPRSPDAEQMESYYQLSHIGGDDFHRQFMDGALWHQRSELATLEREAVSGRDSRLVAFARERQPVVAGAERLAVDVEVRNHLNVPIVSGPGDMR